MTSILRSNLSAALRIAIDTQEQEERKRGYTGPSIFLSGLKEVKTALDRGEYVEVRD